MVGKTSGYASIFKKKKEKKKTAYNRGKKNIKTENLKNFTSDLCEVDAVNVVLTSIFVLTLNTSEKYHFKQKIKNIC